MPIKSARTALYVNAMNEWMNKWMNERTDDGQTNERTNERMNGRTNEWSDLYPAREIRASSSEYVLSGGRSCFVRQELIVSWEQSLMRAVLFHFSWSENLAYSSAEVITVIVAASRSVPYMSVGAYRCVVQVKWAYVCRRLLFVSGTSDIGIIINPSAGTSTDHSQQAKGILSSIYMWRTPATESPYSFYWMGRANMKIESATKITFCSEWNSNNQNIDRVLRLDYLDYVSYA